MKAKLPYLIGAVLGVVIVIAVVFVRMSGQKVGDESQSAEPEKTTVTETAAELATEGTLTEEGELSDEEEGAKTESEEEIEEEIVQEIPLASYVKSVPLQAPDEYDEYWYDEEGDLVSAYYRYRDSNNEIRNGEETIQYLTDENGNKVTGDTLRLEELIGAVGYGVNFGYSDSLPQSMIENYEQNRNGEVNREVSSAEYMYDEQNRLTQRNYTVNYTDDEYFTEEESFTYEESDGQTTVICTKWDPFFNDDLAYRALTFDMGGRLIKYENLYDEKRWGSTDQYEYSPDGKLIRIDEYTIAEDGSQTSFIREYEYNAQGNKTKEVWDGKEHAAFAYDEKGNMTKMESYNESGVWEYDGEGRLTDSTVYYNNGFENDPIEECVAAHQYDDRGRRQLISFHTEKDGQTKDVTVEFQYGEIGKLAKIMLNDHAAVTVAYNDRGALEKLTYDLKDTYSDGFSYLTTEIKNIVKETVYELLPDNIKYMSPSTPDMEPYMVTRPELLQNEIVIEYQ